MEKISEGEPVLKKSRKGFILQDADPPLVKYIPKKPKLVPPLEGYNPCGLSVQLWFNLILFPFVSLVELIKIKRTCKMFATHKGLKRLILDKEYSAFRNAPARIRNRMNDKGWGDNIYIPVHLTGLFMLHIREDFYTWAGSEEKDEYGLFSSKERLWNCFIQELDGNVLYLESIRFDNVKNMADIGYVRRPSHGDNYAKIVVQGINEDIAEWLKSSPN